MIPGIIPIPSNTQKSVTFITNVGSSSNTSSFTFADTPLGAPDSTRLVVLTLSYYKFDTTTDVNSCTVAGVATTRIIRNSRSISAGTGSFVYSEIRSVVLPTSVSSGTIQISFSNSVNRGCEIGVFTLENLQSQTPVITVNDDASAGNPADLSVNVQPQDVAIAISSGVFSSVSDATSWSGATEAYDTTRGASELSRSGAYFQATATQSPRPVSVTNPSAATTNALALWR